MHNTVSEVSQRDIILALKVHVVYMSDFPTKN